MHKYKRRNVFRPTTMRNFSNYFEERYILIDDLSTDRNTDYEKDQFVKEINERLWLAIQEVNAVAKNRILPFLTVRRVVKDKTKLRIIINSFDSDKKISDYEEIKEIDIKNVSHLINFTTLSPQRRVMVSDDIIPGNARMIIDERDQIAAAIDIFLDIAMFNSISFLQSMDLSQKQAFSKVKLDYYYSTKSSCDNIYYLVDKDNPPGYFSFAFATRTDNKTLDYNAYVGLWNRFLSMNYPDKEIINPSPVEQIKKWYVDLGNLDTKYLDNKFWERYSGDFFLLRLNRKPKDENHAAELANFFGISKIDEMHNNETKLIRVGEYFDSFIKTQIDQLFISAFKIVCK